MNENNSKTGLFLLGLALAIGLIVSAIIVSGSLVKIKNSDHYVTVKGVAEKKIVSDFASWFCQYSSRSTDLISAYSKLEKDRDMVLGFLQRNGIGREKMKISSVITNKQFQLTSDGKPTNIISGYELLQNIQISVNDVQLVSRISTDITSLIKDGVEIVSYQPQYFFTKLNDLKIAMLGAATKDAKDRADQLAENSGSKISGLKSASQGVFQITPVNSVDVSDMGNYDLTTIEKSIKAVVTIDFLIK